MLGRPRKGRKHWRSKFHRLMPAGLPPGTLIQDPEAPRPVIQLVAYDSEKFVECCIQDTALIKDYLGKWPVTWVSVIGLGDINIIRSLGEIFHIHPLALEDVVNAHQRPKVEPYSDQLFIVTQMATGSNKFESEQVSIFVGDNFVVSFQEKLDDSFKPISDRIFKGVGRIRQLGSGYLTYCMLDAIVDSYFPILEKYGENLEVLEDEIISRPDKSTIARIHLVKRDLLVMRKAIWPVRDLINFLYRENTKIFPHEIDMYLRDCSDHAIRIVELIETYRELSGDLLDVYLSSLSNRMNDVMRLLAIITTIFVPPTFITGVYGMTFAEDLHHLKAFQWFWGPPFALSMIVIAFIITITFLWFTGMLNPPDSSVRPSIEGNGNGDNQ